MLTCQMQPAVSEVEQLCGTEATATSSDYCCNACCTLHVGCGDLPAELYDIHLDSHSIVPKWACTATYNRQWTSGRAPKLCRLPQLADDSETMPNSRNTAPMLTLYG